MKQPRLEIVSPQRIPRKRTRKAHQAKIKPAIDQMLEGTTLRQQLPMIRR